MKPLTKKLYVPLGLLVILVGCAAGIASAQSGATNLYVNNIKNQAVDQHKESRVVPLSQVLKKIERVRHITFIYQSDLIEGTKVSQTVLTSANLAHKLGKLLAQNGLTYIKKAKGTYVIKRLPMFRGMRQPAAAAQITGTVTDRGTGETLPGVNIAVKGTTTGTATDTDGAYSLVVESLQDTLVFSYVGYQTEQVPINGRKVIDIALHSQAFQGKEMVVTALGIEKEKKELTYSTQDVNTKELTEARELNPVNSLSGKVAGINITRSGGGVGSTSRVLLRGNRSIQGSSEPLYVLDGVPIQGNFSGISPDNIASINVLKGPNAAALYGNDANNGVIVITTRKGSTDGTQISINSTFMRNSPNLLMDYQNVYGQGNGGVYSKSSRDSWGPRMEGQMVDLWSFDPKDDGTQYPYSPQPDNVRDAFQSGHDLSSNLNLSTGNETTQFYFSYTFTNAAGIVPNNDLERNNVDLRVTSQMTDRLSLDAKLSYVREKNNPVVQGGGSQAPVKMMLWIPRNLRTKDMRNFEYRDKQGELHQNYWNANVPTSANPYWILNRRLWNVTSERVISFASLTYDFTDAFSLQVRSSLDRSFSKGETRIYNTTPFAENGDYSLNRSDALLWNSDFLFSYEKSINSDWNINGNVGGSLKKERNSGIGASVGANVGLTKPNYFALSNTQKHDASENVGSPRDVQSLYAFGQVGYKNSVFLNFSGRNDWSSTLPKGNWSFFYPSVGLSAVLSDLIPSFPRFFTFSKLRASWSVVGNDTAPYMTERTGSLSPGGLNGFFQLNTTLPNQQLVPEETRSLELGAEVRFFNNRVGLDFTWYKTNSVNQLFTVNLPPGTGATSLFTNGGNIQNKGIEAVLSSTPVSTKDFTWEFKFNFSRNRNLVKKLHGKGSVLSLTTQGSSIEWLLKNRIIEGGPWGEIYARGFVRDEQGRVVINSNGIPRTTSGTTVRVANFNPNWMGGISNSFFYKDINLSFLIDIRQGGSFVSHSSSILDAAGVTKKTLKGRGGGLIFGKNFFKKETAVLEDGSPNNISTDAETFWKAMGGKLNPTGEVFKSSASNIRLRELSIGYSLPKSLLSGLPFSNLEVSLVARNLFFLYNASDYYDPEIVMGGGKITAGYNAFSPPSTRSYGVNLHIDF